MLLLVFVITIIFVRFESLMAATSNTDF